MFDLIIGFFAICLAVWTIWGMRTGYFERQKERQNALKQKPFISPPLTEPSKIAPAPAPARIPCEYWMMYRDVDGNETARDFDLIKVYERHNRWYFDAHCDLARDERTFRVDRVELLKNNDTGKMWSLEKDIRKHFRELSRNGGF